MNKLQFTDDECIEVLTAIVDTVIEAELDIKATTPSDIESFAALSSVYRKMIVFGNDVEFPTLTEACAAIREEFEHEEMDRVELSPLAMMQ